MKHNQFGRTLIETLAILGVIGILSVSGLQLYAKAMNTIRVNHLMEKVYLLANQIRNEKIEKTGRRKSVDLPSAEKTLSYGYSFNPAASGLSDSKINVVVKGAFSNKICKMLKKKIGTEEYAGLEDIKANNSTSLKVTGCPDTEITSMTFVINSEFKK